MVLERLQQIVNDPNIALTRTEMKQIETDMYAEFNKNKDFKSYITKIAKDMAKGDTSMVDSDTIIKAYISYATKDEKYTKYLKSKKAKSEDDKDEDSSDEKKPKAKRVSKPKVTSSIKDGIVTEVREHNVEAEGESEETISLTEEAKSKEVTSKETVKVSKQKEKKSKVEQVSIFDL